MGRLKDGSDLTEGSEGKEGSDSFEMMPHQSEVYEFKQTSYHQHYDDKPPTLMQPVFQKPLDIFSF